MRKFPLFVICACFVTCLLSAQKSETVRIKAGEDPASSFSPQGFYRFPSFSKGIAVSKVGAKTPARFNYHMLNDEIQFISSTGDTFALSDPLAIDYITIDSTLFYYSNGYLEVLVNHESLKLAKKTRLNTTWEKIGGYGQPSPSGSIRAPSRLIIGNTSKNLSVNQDILIQKESTFYWMDKYNTVLKATKNNLLKLLPPDKKSSIEDYLKKNRTDFNKEEDLKKLLEYFISTA